MYFVVCWRWSIVYFFIITNDHKLPLESVKAQFKYYILDVPVNISCQILTENIMIIDNELINLFLSINIHSCENLH